MAFSTCPIIISLTSLFLNYAYEPPQKNWTCYPKLFDGSWVGRRAREELPQFCVYCYEWKGTCFYIHATHTQLWQPLSFFCQKKLPMVRQIDLKDYLGHEFRNFWPCKAIYVGWWGQKSKFRHVATCPYFFKFLGPPFNELVIGWNPEVLKQKINFYL